jgi:hypothetical protein
MDKFPEAFERFKEDVNVHRIQTFTQLESSFSSWAGWKWRGTYKQMEALENEADKLGLEGFYQGQQHFEKPEKQRKFEGKPHFEVKVSGKTAKKAWTKRIQYSRSYITFEQWQSKTGRTTAYERRVISYMKNHPNASLAEARGHRVKRS